MAEALPDVDPPLRYCVTDYARGSFSILRSASRGYTEREWRGKVETASQVYESLEGNEWHPAIRDEGMFQRLIDAMDDGSGAMDLVPLLSPEEVIAVEATHMVAWT